MKSYRLLLVLLIGLFVVLSTAFGWAVASYLQAQAGNDEATQPVVAVATAAPSTATAILTQAMLPTPYSPVTGTPLIIPTVPEPTQPNPTVEVVSESPPLSPSMDFYGVNFASGEERIAIKIVPQSKKFNRGKPIVISFLPGRRCNFGDKRACVYAYLNENLENTIFVSVHSGVGGEAQAYRNTLEGTLVNSGAYTVKRVHSNMNALEGAIVTISQGGRTVENLELSFISRVPPRSLRKYLSAAVYDALDLAASIGGNGSYPMAPGQPQLVFETCGWRLPGEALSSVATATSASIYIAVIQKSASD